VLSDEQDHVQVRAPWTDARLALGFFWRSGRVHCAQCGRLTVLPIDTPTPVLFTLRQGERIELGPACDPCAVEMLT
jgi:hypothetical protein